MLQDPYVELGPALLSTSSRNEHSGHYGERWTRETQRQFDKFLQKHGIVFDYTEWNRLIVWKPLIRRSDEDWIGVADEPGIWIGGIGGPRSLVDMAEPVWLWPLLERSSRLVLGELEGVWPDISAATGIRQKSDFVAQVIISALASGREYWMSHALDWVEQIGVDEFRDQHAMWSAILLATQENDVSQGLAHRLRKVAKGGRH